MGNIFVAGHNGMVGSAICRRLYDLEVEVITANKNEVDLTNQLEVTEFFSDKKIACVYIAAAKVGGIYANNTFPAEFIYQNLMIQCNLIHSAHLSGVQKLLFLGSSCIYPKNAEQPMKECALLTGPLELTNEPYAISKIAGIKITATLMIIVGRRNKRYILRLSKLHLSFEQAKVKNFRLFYRLI